MMTMSKPLSAGQAQRYHAEQFRDAGENYYTEGHEIRGQWDGRLAAAWGLAGEVSEEHFARLAEGQHPLTGELLVKAQTPHLQTNARGETVRTVEHRAAWDLTFSAPRASPSRRSSAATSGSARRTGRPSKPRCARPNRTCRRAWAGCIRLKPRASGWPPGSSTTARDRSTATRRRSCTPTPSSSI